MVLSCARSWLVFSFTISIQWWRRPWSRRSDRFMHELLLGQPIFIKYFTRSIGTFSFLRVHRTMTNRLCHHFLRHSCILQCWFQTKIRGFANREASFWAITRFPNFANFENARANVQNRDIALVLRYFRIVNLKSRFDSAHSLCITARIPRNIRNHERIRTSCSYGCLHNIARFSIDWSTLENTLARRASIATFPLIIII